MSETPLISARSLTRFYGTRVGCRDVSFDLYDGEVLAIVGESGSGKSTLLQVLAAELASTSGDILFRMRGGNVCSLVSLSEAERRQLLGTDFGFVRQDARDGLRMGVSAGANVAEPLMATGVRNYGRVREEALDWLARVEIDANRIDDNPRTYSGGMRQRLQIARNLVTRPRLVLLDEPTSGLDVSVQARLLDLIRGLVTDLGIAVIIVTHDLAVARLLSHRILVMRHGRVVESGLTDQVLDDPAHAYTQLLVVSVLAA